MARLPRKYLPGGWYHCINRGAGRRTIFFDEYDYAWFQENMLAIASELEIAVMAYCLMPNHWHIVASCNSSEAMSMMFKKLSNQHTKRHHSKYQTIGHGPIYQGRYKSFAIEDDVALNNICIYVMQNPVRAQLVERVEEWKWSGSGNGDSQVSQFKKGRFMTGLAFF